MKLQKQGWLLPVSLTLSLVACMPSSPTQPGTQSDTPSPSSAPTPVATASSSSNPDGGTPIEGTPTLPGTDSSVSPPLIGSSGCTPLVNLNGSQLVSSSSGSTFKPLNTSAESTIVKGYVRLTSTLSCDTDVKNVQYMYRLVPSGEYIVIGALQKPEDSYAFELNTPTLLIDGTYELVTKATLNDGNIILSSPLRITVDNIDSSSASSGGGGGGGGGGGSTGGGGDTGGGTGGNTGGGGTGNVSFSIDTSFNIPAGTTRWTLDIGKQVSSTPLVDAQGNSFFAADNKFFIYDKNGVKTSELTLNSEVTAPAAKFNNLIYFGDANGKLVKVDISNPQSPVSQEITLSGTGSNARFEYGAPAIDCSGNVYIQTRDRKLFKVTPQGVATDLLASAPVVIPPGFPPGATQESRYATPVVDSTNQRVFTGSQDGIRIASLDGNTIRSFIPTTAVNAQGESIISAQLDKAINSPLAVDAQGMAYAVSETGTLYKFDPANPDSDPGTAGDQPIWQMFVGDADAAPVIGSDGTIYIASENGILQPVHPDGPSGTQYSPIGLGNVVEFSTPAIGQGPDGDIIYVGTEGGLFYGFNGTNSSSPLTQRLVKDLGAPIRSDISIASDGTVYAGTLDGRMFTLFGDSTGLANTAWPKAQGNLNGTGHIGSCQS